MANASRIFWASSISSILQCFKQWKRTITITSQRKMTISGWWFGTWLLFSISYMGCHPSHWLTYFSRWLLHHQPDICCAPFSRTIKDWPVFFCWDLCHLGTAGAGAGEPQKNASSLDAGDQIHCRCDDGAGGPGSTGTLATGESSHPQKTRWFYSIYHLVMANYG